MDIIITQWALDSYLNLKHQNVFDPAYYWNTLRPDVMRLKTFPADAKFQNDKHSSWAAHRTRETDMSQQDLFSIAQTMRAAGHPDSFVARALDRAHEFRGIADLMGLWIEAEGDAEERDEIIADIHELLIDIDGPRGRKERYVRFDDLDAIARDVMAFKDRLRAEIEKAMTLTELSQKTGMPLPSLSRFFSQPSMPRRATLLKIADALDLSGVEIASEWSY